MNNEKNTHKKSCKLIASTITRSNYNIQYRYRLFGTWVIPCQITQKNEI